MKFEDYKNLLIEQRGTCAVCGSIPRDGLLVVDHDHNCCPEGRSCGKCIRGLLCRSCNVGLGFFGDSMDALRSASLYLLNAAFSVVVNDHNQIKSDPELLARLITVLETTASGDSR